MSRHTSRNERWTHVNAKEYRSTFGAVQYRRGAWAGTLFYQRLDEETGLWVDERVDTGEYKRPRNAMIGVEDKARETKRRYLDKVRVAFEG